MKHILFLGLKVFSATGGIEKVCRVAGKSLYDFAGEGFKMLVLHDKEPVANKYFPVHLLESCKGSLPLFFMRAIRHARKADVVIMSHINLLPAGWLIKKLFPRKKIILFLHGIEVWEGAGKKKGMLNSCDRFIAVSRYTAQRFSTASGIDSKKISILNNCLDPFLPPPVAWSGNKSVLTLTRLAATEKDKGYDDVIRALAKMKNPELTYIIAGRYSPEEFERIKTLAESEGVSGQVELPGYVEDDAIPELFSRASVYVMPSIKEGFGIVFVEAMYYGVPVIGSGMDGSADALRNGTFGLLVKPGNTEELADAIIKVITDRSAYIPPAERIKEEFGFENYSRKLQEIIQIT